MFASDAPNPANCAGAGIRLVSQYQESVNGGLACRCPGKGGRFKNEHAPDGREAGRAISKLARPGKLPDDVSMATLTKKRLRSHARPDVRLEARVSRDFKRTLQHAAAVTGHKTLKSFLIFSLQSSVSKALEDHRLARLTEQESKSFVQALLHPDAPNAKLRAAFGRYREVTAA